MTARVDYYFSLSSPWSYLGHGRFLDIAARHGASVAAHPADFRATIFPRTGGLPVNQRSPQRQAYRLQELERWRDHLGIPLVLHPAHWPADDADAAAMVVNLREAGGDATGLAGAFMRAVWAEERDIGDRETILAIAAANGHDGGALLADVEGATATILEESAAAMERGVFGAPSYVVGEQVFWGQDRLDFVDRLLAGGSGP